MIVFNQQFRNNIETESEVIAVTTSLPNLRAFRAAGEPKAAFRVTAQLTCPLQPPSILVMTRSDLSATVQPRQRA